MKQLFWKELMEAKFVPIFIPVLVLIVLTLWHNGDVTSISIPAGCVFAGLVAGCSGISGEQGRGTILFLDSLPLSRKDVWLCKLAAAGVITVITCCLTICAGLILGSSLFTHSGDPAPYSVSLEANVTFIQWWLVPVSAAMFGVGCAFFSSSLVDRPLTAIILAAVMSVALPSVFIQFLSGYNRLLGYDIMVLAYLVADVVACCLLASSYLAFTSSRHEGLRRPVVLGSAAALSQLIALALVIMIVGALLPEPSIDTLACSWTTGVGTTATNVDCSPSIINHRYLITFGLESDGAQPVSIVSHDPLMVPSIAFPLVPFDVGHEASVIFTARAPIGKKEFTLHTLNSDGKTAETINISVTNLIEGREPKR
jgi:ABC-type transport system involved in multi-copper enzyme maturation permease subunit